MPISSVNIAKVSNNTYFAELGGIMSDTALRIFPSYANVTISESDDAPLLEITVNSYSRTPLTYDTQGNILTYRYSAGAAFALNDSVMSVSGSKILDAQIAEPDAQDSVICETLRKYVDKLRSDF